jgi:hypothetical protein
MTKFRNTVCSIFIGKWVNNIIYLLPYEDWTECYETSAYKIQRQGDYPEGNIQHTEHGESLKSRIILNFLYAFFFVQFFDIRPCKMPWTHGTEFFQLSTKSLCMPLINLLIYYNQNNWINSAIWSRVIFLFVALSIAQTVALSITQTVALSITQTRPATHCVYSRTMREGLVGKGL